MVKNNTVSQISVDEQVMQLLAQVSMRKKQIELLKVRPSWKTNCTFGKISTTEGRVNIQTVRDLNILVEIYAFLNQTYLQFSQAAKELGLEFDGKWQNYPISDWKDDLKTRVSQLTYEKRLKELEELNARIDKLVTPEQRREMELKDLQEYMKTFE